MYLSFLVIYLEELASEMDREIKLSGIFKVTPKSIKIDALQFVLTSLSFLSYFQSLIQDDGITLTMVILVVM